MGWDGRRRHRQVLRTSMKQLTAASTPEKNPTWECFLLATSVPSPGSSPGCFSDIWNLRRTPCGPLLQKSVVQGWSMLRCCMSQTLLKTPPFVSHICISFELKPEDQISPLTPPRGSPFVLEPNGWRVLGRLASRNKRPCLTAERTDEAVSSAVCI